MMSYVTISILKPIEKQSQHYLTAADYVFQEIDGIMFRVIKNRETTIVHDFALPEIKELVKAKKDVCIVSSKDKYHVILSNMIKKRWTMFVRDVDGKHILGEAGTYDEIKIKADEWLGDNCTWENDFRAISMFGSVVTLVCGSVVKKCVCCKSLSDTIPEDEEGNKYNGFCFNCRETIDKLICKSCPRLDDCEYSLYDR